MEDQALQDCSLTLVRAAAEKLRGRIRHTPIVRSALLDDRSGASLLFKCENFQKTGAFKIRGALNRVPWCDQRQLRRLQMDFKPR